ncbi:MAG: tRNA 2-thiouridine(34) synthase MnmA [Candidatus Margulisiibacteriota bacterium]
MNTCKKQKVLAAMSGGVDSSVAAALLKQQGYDVIGTTMSLDYARDKHPSNCCGITAAHDAKRVCDILEIPHYTLNFKDIFQKKVIDNFIEEYKNGRTPNPCIRCNEHVKWKALMKKTKELGADMIATGHYARIMPNLPAHFAVRRAGRQSAKCQMPNEKKLFKGKYLKKDQSYALYILTQEMLAHTLFPLGDLTKAEVRKIAKDLGLPVADKADSQEICFVEDNDYARFLKETMPECVKPGPILDMSGKVVGQHQGIAFYTIGQKKGIGAHTGRKYVVKIDAKNNTIVIGDDSDLFKKELTASQLNFISGTVPDKPLAVAARIRYNSPEEPAVLEIDGDCAKVRFAKPQRAVTPGQSVVFYQEDEVIGGGIIE